MVAVAEVVSSPGHQHPNNVDGRIGFGSRNRASVRQGKAGGKTREESIGRSSQHLGLAAIVDHATAGLLISQRLLDQAERVLTLGKDLIVFKQKPVAAGVRSCTLAAVGATEWKGPESLSTPSAASFPRTTGCPSRSGASPDLVPQPCSRGFAALLVAGAALCLHNGNTMMIKNAKSQAFSLYRGGR